MTRVNWTNLVFGRFKYDDTTIMLVWNTEALAALVVSNHIHYLDTSGTCMVDRGDASLDLHARPSIVKSK
jgi:hypothetical protein